MKSILSHLKVAPVLILAAVAVGTSVQVGCGGSIERTGTGDDATTENRDDNSAGYGCSPYSYSYGYGCGDYGYGYGYGR